jgi:hypothetical protein
MSELVFEITQEVDGGFVAEALGEGIFTDTWEELRAAPDRLRLHLVRDEVLA